MSTWYEYFMGETIPDAPKSTLSYTIPSIGLNVLSDIENRVQVLRIVDTSLICDTSNNELHRQLLMKSVVKQSHLIPPKIVAPLPKVETVCELLQRTRNNLRSNKFFVHM